MTLLSVGCLASALAVVVSAPQQVAAVSVPPSSSLDAINRLAAQTGVNVVVAVDLRGRRSEGLAGRYTAPAAFARLLQPLGLRARVLAAGVYRIEAAPMRSPVGGTDPALFAQPTELEEVIVTAPVQRGGLDGANGRVRLDPDGVSRARGVSASDAVADLSATVDSTRQGAGRNKLFVRGVADSAFSGPLQATVGQYLGDIRLTYGSPDPDLSLIDIRRVDVFEGPQGARFASGSIGGVVRIEPEPPVLHTRSGLVSGGGSLTSGGAPGADGAVVVNVPLGDRMAGRVAAYTRQEGGFIDSASSDRRNAGGVDSLGLRASLRFVDEAWTVDGVLLGQLTTSDDAELISVQPLPEADAGRSVRQPYRSSLSLVGVSATRRAGAVRITSATSLSRQYLSERFNATQAEDAAPVVVDRRQATTAFSSEVRLETVAVGPWSWNGGAALAIGDARVRRDRVRLGDTDENAGMRRLDRRFVEAAVFGEAIAHPTTTLDLAFGGRISSVRVSNRSDATLVGPSTDDGGDLAVTPSLALRWSTPFGPQVFARYEQGVRPGGVGQTEGGALAFRSDRVTLTEAGLRAPPGAGRWSGELSVGRLDWRDIQADTLTTGGELVTRNIGDGVVDFAQVRFGWRPSTTFSMSGGLFVNESRVLIAGFGTIGVTGGEIPNVAPFGAQFSVENGPIEMFRLPLSLAADLRYVGRSQVGFGVGFDGEQGGYLRADLSARLGDERRALTVRVSNPFDTDGSRFGIGSPYRDFDRQYAPIRPLTVRIGYDAAF